MSGVGRLRSRSRLASAFGTLFRSGPPCEHCGGQTTRSWAVANATYADSCISGPVLTHQSTPERRDHPSVGTSLKTAQLAVRADWATTPGSTHCKDASPPASILTRSLPMQVQTMIE